MNGKPLPARRSIRLPAYDYAQAGAYFVTVCVKGRACVLADVLDGESRPSEIGEIVQAGWNAIPVHFPHVVLDAFVVMPNHIHGVLFIAEVDGSAVGAQHAVPLQRSEPARRFGTMDAGSLPAILRSFKSASTRRVNLLRKSPGDPLWQRNYYEHVIRNDEDLFTIRQYVADNPVHWALDEENPERGIVKEARQTL